MVSPSTESLSSVSGSEIDAVPASSKVNVPYPTAGRSAFRSMNAVDVPTPASSVLVPTTRPFAS